MNSHSHSAISELSGSCNFFPRKVFRASFDFISYNASKYYVETNQTLKINHRFSTIICLHLSLSHIYSEISKFFFCFFFVLATSCHVGTAVRFFKSRKNENLPSSNVSPRETEARKDKGSFGVRWRCCGRLWNTCFAWLFAVCTRHAGRPLYGKRIEWRHLLFP